jgi:hypothetical protein
MTQLTINSNYILDGLYTFSITIHKISKGLFPPCSLFPIIEDDDPLYFAEYVDKYIVNKYEPDYIPTIFPIYHIITDNNELKSFWLSQHAYYNSQPFDFNCVVVYLDDKEAAHKAIIEGKHIYAILTDESICQKDKLKTIYNDTIINVKFIIECNYAEPYNFEINDTIDCVPKYLSELFRAVRILNADF